MTDEPAAIPPPPWDRVPRRATRARRDPITKDAIVAAALRILDAEGLDELNMRRIGEALDTGAGALYWHVGSKDGLLDLLLDEIIGEQRVPDPEPDRWQEQLKEVAHGLRATILAHRDVVRISIGRIPMGPNALTWSERVFAILRAGGVPDALAVPGQHLLTSVVNGFTLDETGGPSPEDAHDALDQAAGAARDYVAALPPDRFPHLVSLADQFAFTDPEARFTLLVDLFVGGLGELVRTHRT